MGPTWGPPGADRTQVGPVLVPRTLLSGVLLFIGLTLAIMELSGNFLCNQWRKCNTKYLDHENIFVPAFAQCVPSCSSWPCYNEGRLNNATHAILTFQMQPVFRSSLSRWLGPTVWWWSQSLLVLLVVVEALRRRRHLHEKIHEHDGVFKWKHFPRYWPFVPGIPRSPVNSPHKGQWRGALMFSLIWSVLG